MSLSTKWTAVSLFALTALGAGSIAFAGCSVTSGSPTDVEGGTVTPTDGGGGTDTSVPEDGSTNSCPGNTKQTAPLVNAACQTALDSECCTELTGCFGLDVPAASDCNVYSACIADCKKPLADGAAPTTQEISDCETMLCDANSPKTVQDAYTKLIDCASKPGSKSIMACQ